MSKVTFTTSVNGPFFHLAGQAMTEAQRDTIEELVREGEAWAQQVLKPGRGVDTGAYRSSIHGRLVSSALGLVEEDKSIKGKWLESGHMRGSRFKGYGAFRKAKNHLVRVAREMAGRHYAKAVRRLT